MGKNEITWPIAAMCSKELTVKGSFRYSQGDYEMAVKFLESGQVKVKELITGTVDFKDAEQAFESVKKAEGIKTLIKGPE
jgi:D-xylulose reductase